jgi:hypothetical protein
MISVLSIFRHPLFRPSAHVKWLPSPVVHRRTSEGRPPYGGLTIVARGEKEHCLSWRSVLKRLPPPSNELTRALARWMIGQTHCAFGADDVAGLGPKFRKYVF